MGELVCEVCSGHVTPLTARYDAAKVIYCQKCFNASQTMQNTGIKINFSITKLLYWIAGICLMISFVLFFLLWPYYSGYGVDERTIFSFLPSFMWLMVGVIQFALFAAMGKGLIYLKQIAENTSIKE